MPYASLGFVGLVKVGSTIVRATSCDIKASQNIDTPNLVDGKYDKTTYKLDPIEVGGSLAFPAVHEAASGTASLGSLLWDYAFSRNATDGRLQYQTDIEVKYFGGFAYKYTSCIIDTYEFSVTQGDMVNINCGVIGKSRTAGSLLAPNYGLRNTRVVTWNDAVVNFGDDSVSVTLDEIRSFTLNLNNNSQRFYTLGSLNPTDIAATKRDISGNLVVMGVNPTLANRAYNNQSYCTSNAYVTFGYTLSGIIDEGCAGTFSNTLYGVVFQIEELAISNDIIESTVNYKVLPGLPGTY